MRPSLLLAVLATLGIAAFAWCMLRDPDGVPQASRNGDEASKSARASAGATQPGSEAPPREEVEQAEPVARDHDAKTKGLRLRVQLRGVRPDAPWTAPAKLEIWGDDRRDQELVVFEETRRPDVDARVVFELPDWCAPQADGYVIQRVSLSATDPNYEPLQRRYQSRDLGRELVVDVEFVSELSGNVRDTAGKPVAQSRVVAFASRNGQPLPGMVATAPTEPDGSYRLLVPPGAPMWLVALPCRRTDYEGYLYRRTQWSMTKDLLPATKVATATAGAPTIVPDFVLERAAHVTGTVQWDDGTPIAYAWLEASPRGDTLSLTDGEYLRRIGGRVAPGMSIATDQQGRFALPTLAGTTIDVRVLRGPRSQDAGRWIGDLPQQPASVGKAVVFTVPRPVVLRARCGAEPSAYATVEVAAECMLQTDKSGELTVVPTAPVRVRAMRRDLRSPWYEISPADAGRTIDLSLRQEKLTAVTIEVDDAATEDNHTILYRRDGGPEQSEFLPRNDTLELFLEPGRYDVALVDVPSFLGTIADEVEVIVGDEPTSVRLRNAPGGTFAVKATDGHGAWAGGTCTVRNAEGREWRMTFEAGDETRGRPGELLATGVNTFRRQLPPGDYELRCDFGALGTHRETVTIRANRTTDVRIRLP